MWTARHRRDSCLFGAGGCCEDVACACAGSRKECRWGSFYELMRLLRVRRTSRSKFPPSVASHLRGGSDSVITGNGIDQIGTERVRTHPPDATRTSILKSY
ncbi:hypothetical protein MTP99_000085 [Tenebrio molitor]|nr:hypothetical protein MTP99_000085 [Tenebrio molitor]